MSETYELKTIGHVRSDFPEKFGIPRQAGIVDALESAIIFEPEYRREEALRGLDGFSHIWVIWQFSEAVREDWSPTVRPPRLGGNQRMGVFATRSPFRPNPIGLSCVELSGVEWDTPDGPVLHVRGADLVDGTPILDIKPYLPYCDAKPEAKGGFTDGLSAAALTVDCPPALLERLPETDRPGLLAVLANDPRPRYQNDPQRLYGLAYAGHNVTFRVEGDKVTVVGVE